jgi:uncharacterized protein (UPF0332 family)
VKPQVLPKELSAWIHDVFEARLEADYGVTAGDAHASARAALSNAEQFVAQIQPVLNRLLDELRGEQRTGS